MRVMTRDGWLPREATGSQAARLSFRAVIWEIGIGIRLMTVVTTHARY